MSIFIPLQCGRVVVRCTQTGHCQWKHDRETHKLYTCEGRLHVYKDQETTWCDSQTRGLQTSANIRLEWWHCSLSSYYTVSGDARMLRLFPPVKCIDSGISVNYARSSHKRKLSHQLFCPSHKAFDSGSSMFFLKSWPYNVGLIMAEELLFYCSKIFHI